MAATVIRPLLELLRDMRSMIERIDDERYLAPAPGRSSGGVGGHVRHCLDHVGALTVATRTGVCAYDRRARGTEVERCRLAALRRIAGLEAEIANIGRVGLEVPIEVETQVDTDGTILLTTSTVGREIVFVTSHTIHHNAIVAHLLALHDVDMGPRFGFAAATPSNHQQLTCAQ